MCRDHAGSTDITVLIIVEYKKKRLYANRKALVSPE